MITNIFDSHGQRGLELDSINLSSELLKYAMRDERSKVEESYNRTVSIPSTEPRNHRIIIAGFTNIIKHNLIWVLVYGIHIILVSTIC